MFAKVLIANRGEIALRIIRACREMGIKSVAVYSEVDEDSLHVRFADESVCIGPARSDRSYLNISNIISAALVTGADAIHPGYGYLAEDAGFARICEDHKIKFIGPSPRLIRLMGDKATARATMKSYGVPILPGSDGEVQTAKEALDVACEVGFPVLIKASGGGGGKGMRIVRRKEDIPSAFQAVQGEAAAAFGKSGAYIEKYVGQPRHIEFQILADEHGNVVHLGERECSIQRRHQKLIEESPSPIMTTRRRHSLGALAIDAARKLGYTSAGTIEFLMDPQGRFYFLEMNTRIQVEHPVTEFVTGVDIVKEMIRIAAGEKLGLRQSDVKFNGHALECRINAEHPETFTPSPGKITACNVPGGIGVRIDTAIYKDYVVLPYYDSLIAKVIVHAPTRGEAIARMQRCLEEFVIEGIETTIPFQMEVMRDPDFQKGHISTGFVERLLGDTSADREPGDNRVRSMRSA
ncbi:MAG: acetyl-CoA carboxylase biotin carboxylase subunit [Candidatus Coatesbacteria bacterium]|nr:MAG: acetyl-CoA carboxylase biotin carboxylase subunit [Candidatus Coatesbacteria bacterium]